jgi:hypothetical protein
MHIVPTSDWVHMMRTLKATAQALKEKEQHSPSPAGNAGKGEKTTPQLPIDPAVRRILAQAHDAEAQILEDQRASQEMNARTERAERAWRRVASFRGDAIQRKLSDESLHRWYAELIVELGQVLRTDDWQANVEAIAPGPSAKQCAVEVLRQAMNGDVDNVVTLVNEFVKTLFTLGLEANSWLREGLMYEVLRLSPPPASPFFDQEQAEKAEEAGAADDQLSGSGGTSDREKDELVEREREILQALLILKATGKRRSVPRRKAAKQVDPAAKSASYNKAVASLVEKKLVESKAGPRGGIWLTPAGMQLAESIQRSSG